MNKRRQERIERRKKDKEWADGVKRNWYNKCAICGKTERLNAHHLLPREIKETRFDVLNGIALCPKCHKFGILSAHKNGIWFTAWIALNEPERLSYLCDRLQEIFDAPFNNSEKERRDK